MGYREARRIMLVEDIVTAYYARENYSDGWAKWSEKNKYLSGLLIDAERLAEGE
jgi:hypothetical protein